MEHRFSRDSEADEWERCDFPILCQTCLGDNPYNRMTRADRGKECEICTRPFTVYRWKAGRDGRFKKTVICQTCTKLKNVCQACLLDLEYGLPVQVRDTALGVHSYDSIPKSDVNREYYAEEYDRRARIGIDFGSSYGKAPPNGTIRKLQRPTPYDKRNRAPLCSFYARGSCNRGAACAFTHEMPVTGELSHQNIKDRYYGDGKDPVAKKLLYKAGQMSSLAPPDDESIKTLYICGLDARVTERDLVDIFYSYGQIESVRTVLKLSCAFVNYKTREGAERAAEDLSNKLVIKGLRLKLFWGKSQARRPELEDQQQQQQRRNQPSSYFTPSPSQTCYPSMDPQRMGAQQKRHYSYQRQNSSSPYQRQNLSSPYGYVRSPSPYQQYPHQRTGLQSPLSRAQS